MIGFFEGVYEGELLYSSLSRCYRWSLMSGHRSFTEELFGRRTVSPTIEFQSNLIELSRRIGKLYSPNELLNGSTLYPLYEPFLFKSEQKRLKEMMLGDGGLGIKGMVGFLAGSICKKDSLSYCPVCIKEDAKAGKSPYFRTVHQMQGVKVCAKHGVALVDYPMKRDDMSRIEYIWFDDGLIDGENETNLEEFDHVISGYFDDMYSSSLKGYDGKRLIQIYRDKLDELGYIKLKGNLSVMKFKRAFETFYGKEILERYESGLGDGEHAWFRVMLQNKRKKLHPIRHILMIHFLFGSIQSLKDFDNKVDEDIWYPCLNKISGHYGNRTISKAIVTYDYKSRVPVGNFKCPVCGFHYSRKMSDDEFEVGRIKAFGPVWMGKLAMISDRDDLSLREKARRMYCDPKTVKKYSGLN